MSKPSGYWTKERCQEEALKYKTKTEFINNSKGAHSSAYKNGWLDEMCSHMIKLIGDKWTKERCKEVIKKCSSIKEFHEKYSSAYQSCVRNKWLDELCVNLHRILRKKGYWTKEKCLEAALECHSKKEFETKYSGAYGTSIENKWKDFIYEKCNFKNDEKCIWIIYSYIILNKYVYVGLTKNEKSRKSNHLKNEKDSSVNRYITKNNIKPDDILYKMEIDNVTDVKQIKELESFYLNK